MGAFLLLLFLLIPLIKSRLGYFYIPGHTVFHWNIVDLPEIILLHKSHLPTISGFHLLIRCEISCTTPAYFGMWCCLTLHGDCAYYINCCVFICTVSQLCLEDTVFLNSIYSLNLYTLSLSSATMISETLKGVMIYIFLFGLSGKEFLILYTLAHCWLLC